MCQKIGMANDSICLALLKSCSSQPGLKWLSLSLHSAQQHAISFVLIQERTPDNRPWRGRPGNKHYGNLALKGSLMTQVMSIHTDGMERLAVPGVTTTGGIRLTRVPPKVMNCRSTHRLV